MLNTPLQLSVDELLIEAKEITGIDIVDADALEPLTVLVKSFNEEGQLHEEGIVAIHQYLLHLLCNRLRMQRDFAVHPEIRDQKIEAPIFVCGLPRTGSTKAQKLFSASEDFNWLPFWQAYNPCLFTGSKKESTDARIQDTEKFCQWFAEESPDYVYGHPFETHQPEEESFILMQSLRTGLIMGWADIFSYVGWVNELGAEPQLEYLKDCLKYLQWQGLASESKRWFLKGPGYTGLEEALFNVFPDASLVITHRHPKEFLPSVIRVCELYHVPFTHSAVNVDTFSAGFAAVVNQQLMVRKQNPKFKFYDLDYRRLITSVEGVIEDVYHFCNVELTPQSKQRMLAWNSSNPQHKKGAHRYSLADYGLTEQQLNETFADYIQFVNGLR